MKFSIRRFNEWLIVILLFAVITFLASAGYYSTFKLPEKISYLINPHPTTVINRINSLNAIEIFRGDEIEDYEINFETISMLINVVLYLIIGPFLFYLGFKKSKEHEEKAKPWYWFAGAVICVSALLSLTGIIIRAKVIHKTVESSKISKIKDELRSELVDIGFAIAEYEILKDGLNAPFSIQDLEIANLKFEYSIDQILSDTLVTITALSSEIKDYSVSLDIRPYSRERMIKWN